jgi:hypothetical protein
VIGVQASSCQAAAVSAEAGDSCASAPEADPTPSAKSTTKTWRQARMVRPLDDAPDASLF